MRLGLNIEFDGRDYDILELPAEAFIQLIPGLTGEQYHQIDREFEDFWPEPTKRRRHILDFASELAGTSIDFLMLNRQTIDFDETDILAYIETHTKQGHRPS